MKNTKKRRKKAARKSRKGRPVPDNPLVDVNENSIPGPWRRLFNARNPLPPECLYVSLPYLAGGGYCTPVIAILSVALLMGFIVLAAIGATWLIYLVWTVAMIVPHFFIWPRYLAHLEKEKEQTRKERFGLFLLPEGLLLRQPFQVPHCTLLPRAQVSGARSVRIGARHSDARTCLEIRYETSDGTPRGYETGFAPGKWLIRLITDWLNGIDTRKVSVRMYEQSEDTDSEQSTALTNF